MIPAESMELSKLDQKTFSTIVKSFIEKCTLYWRMIKDEELTVEGLER